MAAEGTSQVKEGEGGGPEEAFEIPLLPDNLLGFYFENEEYRMAEGQGIVPKTQEIVVEMLLIMMDIEDRKLLEKLISDIVRYQVEIEQTELETDNPKEKIVAMLEAARESLKVSKSILSTSVEEDISGVKNVLQLAKRLALGVIQSNTESDFLRFVLGSENMYVIICTSKPCTPLRVLLWVTKEEKSASDYLKPSSSDFNPSLISRIEALRRLIWNGIKCILLYEAGNDLSDTDKSIVCKRLKTKLGEGLSFYANLPKAFFESEENLNHSGLLCYSVDRSVGSSYWNVNYAFIINATQHRQHPHLDTVVVNAGNPRNDPSIGRNFQKAFQFVSEYLPTELTKDVNFQLPSTSKE